MTPRDLETAPLSRSLDQLRSVEDPAARALSAAAFVIEQERVIAETRRIRDAAVREYRKTHSISQTATACGISPATVKAITR